MLSAFRTFKRFRHTARIPIKVAIVGAVGRIGRHLALLLKQNNDIMEIALQDVADPEGVREDVSHVDNNAKVTAFAGDDNLAMAVACSQLVVVVGGASHSAKVQTREDLFEVNAGFIETVITAIAQSNQKLPFVHIVTNPVNGMVPVAAEVLTHLNKYDPRKLSGSTSIDIIRARTFIGELKEQDPSRIRLPVIGGHSSKSILPIISKSEPDYDISDTEAKALIDRTQVGAKEVTNAYKGEAGGFMACAYSNAWFCNSVVEALRGKTVDQTAFIPCNLVDGIGFLATGFSMNADGVKEVHNLPNMSAHEQTMFNQAVQDIQDSMKCAKKYATKFKKE